MQFVYTAEQLEFLQKQYKKLMLQDLVPAFNTAFGLDKTKKQIRSALRNNKFRCGRGRGSQKGECRLFTPEQVRFIKKEYARAQSQKVTDLLNEKFGLNIAVSQFRSFVKNHKIKCGRMGGFEKGHIPHNAGTTGFMHKNKTSFKKGSIPANVKPLGSERICSKDGYVLIKVAEKCPYTGRKTRYRQKHVYVWEQEHGPVPSGHAILFKDGDRTNCDPENLKMVTRRELLYLNKNGYMDLPDELKPVLESVMKVEIQLFAMRQEKNQRV